MPSLAHGSVLISLVACLFAAVLMATPAIALLNAPHNAPPMHVPGITSHVSALA
ncbi:hypothetical protein [Xanthobacter tagetidis]|jgi:hypothetical protein|uniref:hypothetical protein n=1 Tax=Xanthobacter tagetidis TaxID=60216 RepID=UPI00147576A0|nr:hypothetical protein [Xanthobacter tagetidis]MBB6307692.1 hypothetical protein [Xanthobacter tagetidis]